MDTHIENVVNPQNIAKHYEARDSSNKRNANEDFENKRRLDFVPNYYDKATIKGKVVLVVNEFKQNKYKKRKGAERDRSNLKSIFKDEFGFEIVNENQEFSLSKSELDAVLKETSSMDYTDTDIFVFAISTHGEERPKQTDEYEQALMCEDEKYVFTSEIIDKFCCNPSLDGKPKIFFIQACRSRHETDQYTDTKEYDSGHSFKLEVKNELETCDTVHDIETVTKKVDKCSLTETNVKVLPTSGKAEVGQVSENYQTNQSNLQEKADAGHKKEDEIESQPYPGDKRQNYVKLLSSIRCPTDCLVVYASQSGKIAWHNEAIGSWIFHELYEVIRKYKQSSPVDFFDILTKTAFRMAQRESNTLEKVSHGKKAVTVIQHRLTKGLQIPLVKRGE